MIIVRNDSEPGCVVVCGASQMLPLAKRYFYQSLNKYERIYLYLLTWFIFPLIPGSSERMRQNTPRGWQTLFRQIMIYFHLKNYDDVKQESGWDCCKRWKDDQLNISGKLSPFSRWKMEKLPLQPWRRFFQLFLQFIVAAEYSKAHIKLYLGLNLKNL